MILTVTLNPVLDRVVEIAGFRAGKVNLVGKERIRIAGGKGINVSRVVKVLGEKTLATGWLGGKKGRIIRRNLEEENIDTDFVFIKKENRLNLTILDPLSGKETHLVEEGPLISYPEIKNLKEKLKNLAERARIVVFSGSIPRGVGEGIYDSLISLVLRQDSRIISILDTRGEPLKKGLKAKPFMLKPNKEEIEALAGRGLNRLEELIQMARTLSKKYAKLVVISQGKGDVLAIKKREALILTPPSIKSLNPVGAGDALVAGFAVGLLRGMDLEEMAVLGVAAGSASAEKGREGVLSFKRIEELTKKVKWRRYSPKVSLR